jgi:hypothetical protein
VIVSSVWPGAEILLALSGLDLKQRLSTGITKGKAVDGIVDERAFAGALGGVAGNVEGAIAGAAIEGQRRHVVRRKICVGGSGGDLLEPASIAAEAEHLSAVARARHHRRPGVQPRAVCRDCSKAHAADACPDDAARRSRRVCQTDADHLGGGAVVVHHKRSERLRLHQERDW